MKKAPKKPSTLPELYEAAERSPAAAHAWLDRLENVQWGTVEAIFDRIPEAKISDVSIDFALRQLQLNQDALLNLDL